MKKIFSLLILGLSTTAMAQMNPALGPGNGGSVGFLAAATGNGQSQGQNNQFNSSLINSNQNFSNGNNVITVKMPQKNFWQKLREDTTFTYYQQFLGPTAAGRADQTYNVFQAASSGPEQKSGRAPIQSFHAFNLRHQINSDWGVGVSLAVSKGYSAAVTNPNGQFIKKQGDVNKPGDQFFNSRAYVNTPAWKTSAGTLFSTISYEAPTSVISRQENMKYGWVVAESFAFKLPTAKWAAGWTAQAYRMYYKQNVVTTPFRFADGTFGTPSVTSQQTLILSTGPYLNYIVNDHWTATSAVILDWDQRGAQSGTTKFNNNLPHRGRLGISYFPTNPMLKNLASVGVFTQALLKFRPGTTAFGAEFSLRF